MNRIIPILAALAIAGCASNRDKSVLVKSTVLGMEVAPGASAPGAPALRLGLVRNQYVAVPKDSVLVAISEGDLRSTRQTASEELRFGAEAMVTHPVKTNAPTAHRSVTASLTNTVKVKAK
jgi:hypothetical protein